jgi:hypothetical protein
MQKSITTYFPVTRVHRCHVGSIESDDDAPLVRHYQVVAASDRRDKHFRYEEEAEECSCCDEDEDGSDDDSFVVDDHISVVSGESSNGPVDRLHEICRSLRNRRQFLVNNLLCPQCIRMIQALLIFIDAITATVPSP